MSDLVASSSFLPPMKYGNWRSMYGRLAMEYGAIAEVRELSPEYEEPTGLRFSAPSPPPRLLDRNYLHVAFASKDGDADVVFVTLEQEIEGDVLHAQIEDADLVEEFRQPPA